MNPAPPHDGKPGGGPPGEPPPHGGPPGGRQSGPFGHKGGMADEPAPYRLGENLRAIWKLRSYFLPYLAPAAGLLLLALVQADIATTAARAGGRVIDGLMAADPPAAAPGIDAAAPPPQGGSADRQSMSPTGYLFGLVSRDASPLNLAFMLALLLVAGQALSIGVEQLRSVVSLKFRNGMQRTLVDSLARETYLTRGRRSPGVTGEIFMNDAAGLSGLLIFGLVQAFEDVIKLSVYVIALCMIPSGWIVAAMIVPLAILYQAGVTGFFLSRTARTSQRSESLNVRVRARASEFFGLLGRLLYFKGERREAEKLLSTSVAGGDANRRFQLVSSIEGSVSGLLAMLALPLVVLLLRGVLEGNPGTAVEAQMLVLNVIAAIGALLSIPTMLASYSPSLRRVEEILDVPPIEREPDALAALRARSTPPDLAVRDLTFAYPGAERPMLSEVGFEVPSGARVGIIADNGTGKSTLARLLVGDLRPDSGRIRIGGIDVTGWHLLWRRELVAFVPAEPGFVSGSVADNVLFGRHHEDVRAFDDAVDVCGVRAFTQREFGGMDVPLDGDPEYVFSSGQKKQVSIARLMVGDQPIWVIDEPGANLSPSTMGEVASALDRASEGRTCLIITHDPDVFVTDFNLYFEMGRLADVGPHRELFAKNPGYRKLVQRYVHEREEAALAPAGAPAERGPDVPPGPTGPPPFGR